MKGIDLSTMPMGGFSIPRDKEPEERKKKFAECVIREYTNGWKLCEIDKHPDAEYFRNPENDEAFPDEKYVIVGGDNISGNTLFRYP